MKSIFTCFCIVFCIGNSFAQEGKPACASKAFEQFLNKRLKEINATVRQSALFNKFRENRLGTDRSLPVVTFIWPLRASLEYRDIPNYYSINNFVDIDQADTTNMFDYNCEERTYEGHRGIDIDLYPFMWYMMEEEYVEVLAAADGIVCDAWDNNVNDYNCQGCESSNDSNNGVILLHADGSKTIYYHIKSFSVTVAVGDTVNAGDMIANVASSGCSTGPHLHFEVRDPNDVVIEPFAGTCNSTTSESWWINQKPYWALEVNRVMCHYHEPELMGLAGQSEWCPSGELMYARNHFEPGDDIYYGVALKDVQFGQAVTINVYDHAGSSFFYDFYIHAGSADNTRYLVFDDDIPNGAPDGTYQIWVEVGTTDYYHFFSVGCKESYTLSGNQTAPEGYIAGNSITSSRAMTEPEQLLLQAGTEIHLTPGFHVMSTASAHLVLRGCNFSH